jgi:hypothetical protein
MLRRNELLSLLVIATVAGCPLAGCGSDVGDDTNTPDSGGGDAPSQDGGGMVDATMDSGSDATVDAGMDATVDAGMDGTVDTGMDVTVDTGMDVTVDTGMDATADTGTDAGMDATADAGDAGAHDGAADAPIDAMNDAPTDASHADAEAGAGDGGADATVDASTDAASDAHATDATSDAHDSGIVNTTTILDGKSHACLVCAQTSGCVPPAMQCEALQGNAAAGPGAGVARAELCLETLSCVLTTNCASSGTGTPCYCGSAQGASCLSPGNANGMCKSQEERGLETTDPAKIATGFGDSSTGGGVANELVQCLNDNSCSDCFQ